ncbi:hypothetical protein A0H81_11809 [Grifola frondosa]|uniref:Uncharacterized protein n=1 Tax=Grifola frondosa TaxID=5627 RepID=A0A1C7LWB5_GRIFR|nr:hypothetical protein A0H81_11809 [Grifola frondosa]
MPAPESTRDSRPALGHVLRAIVRTTLATTPPYVAAAFTSAARRRLEKSNMAAGPIGAELFAKIPITGLSIPTPELHDTLKQARALYGAGMGLSSLGVLTDIVRATIGARWEENGEMDNSLAAIDLDITQAIQSSKEEMDSGRITDLPAARTTVARLHAGLIDSSADAKTWGCDPPFEQATISVEYWKL